MATRWFTVKGKLKALIKPTISKVNNNITSMIISFLITTTVICTSLGIWYYQTNLITLYHVYVDEQEIGVVDNKELVKSWQSQYLQKLQSKNDSIILVAKNTITFVEESRYKGKYDNYQVLGSLSEILEVEAKGILVYVDGQAIGIVKDMFAFNNAIASIKQAYIPKVEKNTIVAANYLERRETDQQLYSITFKEKIDTVETTVAPDKIISEEKLTSLLKNGIKQEKLYIVGSNESIDEILHKFKMTFEELADLNPDIKKGNLQEGEEITVYESTPFLTVETQENLFQTERIPYRRVYIYDDTMYFNESKVLKEGFEGKKEVEYALIKENGVLKEIKIIGDKLITAPVNEIVVQGTMEIPPTGSGILAWPTNEGTITSFYGQRWGSFHNGIDIAGTDSSEVFSADNGTIIFAGWKNGYGKTVIIDHRNGTHTLYAHMNEITVNKGDLIAKGQKIGMMGSTGRATGVHLHFEILINEENVNPLDYFGV